MVRTASALRSASEIDAGGQGDAFYHIYVYGKIHDPVFQMYQAAVKFLAQDRRNVECTVEGFYETQYEQQLRYVVSKYGGSFSQAKPSAPLIFAETEDSVLFFLNEARFLDWASKRFKYEDNTRLIFYRRVGNKALKLAKETSGRSYCAIGFQFGEDDGTEVVHLELFDEECPLLARNFLDMLSDPRFEGHPVHRVKAGAWVQAGDIVDGTGMNSVPAGDPEEMLRHESFQIPHDRGGLLGMANHGKDTNGSQFYITVRELPFLNGRSVIFGRVISGMRTVLKISKGATRNERPVREVKIFNQKDHLVLGGIQQQMDREQEDAATKMQAIQRGRVARQKTQKKKVASPRG